MAKQILGPKCRLCRRESVKLFLKGARCFGEKCAMVRHPQPPGQHGGRRIRRRLSSYGSQLREKQKVKRIYSVTERQFRNYYRQAQKNPGITGFYLLQLLERRFDNVIYKLGLAHSRRHARTLIRQKKFNLNGKSAYTPSITTSVGDSIGVAIEKGIVYLEDHKVSPWLVFDDKRKEGKVIRLPEREDIDLEIDEQLIVEFYSL